MLSAKYRLSKMANPFFKYGADIKKEGLMPSLKTTFDDVSLSCSLSASDSCLSLKQASLVLQN